MRIEQQPYTVASESIRSSEFSEKAGTTATLAVFFFLHCWLHNKTRARPHTSGAHPGIGFIWRATTLSGLSMFDLQEFKVGAITRVFKAFSHIWCKVYPFQAVQVSESWRPSGRVCRCRVKSGRGGAVDDIVGHGSASTLRQIN